MSNDFVFSGGRTSRWIAIRADWGLDNADNLSDVCAQSRVSRSGSMWSHGIVGPFAFEEEQGATVRINSHRFVQMLKTELRH